MASKVPRNPRKGGKATPSAHNPKAEPGDNSLHGEEADRVQLISIVSKLSAADEKIAEAQKGVEAAKIPLAAAKGSRKTILKLGVQAGFSEKEIEKRLEEMNTPTREMARLTERERKHRRWLGIIDDDQEKLQLGGETPVETRDEAHWMGEGYKAGLRQQERKPPPECAERFVQPWLTRYDVGLQEVLAANVPGGQRLRAQAAADFQADNPEVDVAAAARKLKNDPTFMARGAAPGESPGSTATASSEPTNGKAPTPTSDASTDISSGASQSAPTDPEAPFEATEEELASQSGREGIKAKREGNNPGAAGDVI